MKRFHVHVAVPDLEAGIRFYSTMFGARPSVVKPDYAKWMLDDPRVNFAISARAAQRAGVNHLGVQAENDGELAQIHANLLAADSGVVAEKNVSCCYARSDKYWVKDPAGIAWESFHTLESAPVYEAAEAPGACGTAKTACCS